MADTPLGYYKWYPRDFYSSTTVKSMSFTGRAIYRELLDIQWESERLANVKRLPSTLGITLEQWNEFAEYFDELFPNGQNPRLKALREEAVSRSQKCAQSGSKGGKTKRTKSKREANAKQGLSQTETETETDIKKLSKKETKPESRNIADEYCRSIGLPHYECEKFWDHWNNIQEWKDVKDWQSRARTWKNNFVRYGGKLATPETAKPVEVPFVSPWEDAV